MSEDPFGLAVDDATAALATARRMLADGRAAELAAAALRLVGGEGLWEREQVLQRVRSLRQARALLDPLLDALHDAADAERRNAARSVLAALASPGAAADAATIDRLGGVLSDDADVDARVLAATALGESGNRAARPWLERALHDPIANVGAAAADALGALGAVDALDALIGALEAADPWVRTAAVVSLGRLGERRAASALAAAARDPHLAAAAIPALGELGDPGALDALREFVVRGSELREAALLAAERVLSARPDVAPPDWLRDALRGEEPRLAAVLRTRGDEAAADLLGILGSAQAAACLVDALSSPFAPAAAAALGRLPAETARAVLIDRLADCDEPARASVLAALPPLHRPREVEAVLPFLGSPDDGTRAAAVEALGRSEPSVVLPPLAGALERPESRHAAVRVLGFMGDSRCLPLASLLDDDDADIRHAAAEGLARCATGEVRTRIVAALERETQRRVRLALIQAIGAAGGPEAVAALEPLLSEPDPATRFAAARALGRTAAAEAMRPLLRLLDDATRDVQAGALLALGELGERGAAESVAQRIVGADADLRLTAAYALRELATPRVVQYLERALEDGSWAVRRTAARTLAALAARGALDRLRALAERDPDRLVREAARDAVARIESARPTGDAA